MSDIDWHDVCTWELCGLHYAFFGYRPSKGTNLTFAVLFGISMIVFLAQSFVGKRWLGFTIAMVSGCALEFIGYIGRVLAYKDMWHNGPFLTQIVCLTIAPAFLAAGIYLCLSRIVVAFGSENSRIKPNLYPRIFIPCDILSLFLQAAGGGYASIKTQQHEDPEIGNNIMIAGLTWQVFTLVVFIVLALDFAIRTNLRTKKLGANGALDPRHAALRKSWVFKGFLIALSLSTLCIFTRCVYRVVELSEGWQGHLITVQSYFVGLEGALIFIAVFLLNLFHPGFCFKEALDTRARSEMTAGRTWYGRKKRVILDESNQQNMRVQAKSEETPSSDRS